MRNMNSSSRMRRRCVCSPLAGPNAVIRIEGQFVEVETVRSKVSFTFVVDACSVPHARTASREASSVPVNGLGTVGARK